MQKNIKSILSFLKKGKSKRKASLLSLLALATITSGVFIYSTVFANPEVSVLKAAKGTNISLDTSSEAAGGGNFTELDPIQITEGIRKDIDPGQHTFTLPDGWEFDTTQSIQRGSNAWGSGIDYQFIADPTPSATAFSVWITWTDGDSFTEPGVITLSNIWIRPTTETPTSGVAIIHSGEDINGVGTTVENNFGDLSTVAGDPAKVYIETAIAGSGNEPLTLDPQSIVAGNISPTVYSIFRDQFDNFVSNTAPDSWVMTNNVDGGIVDGDIVGTESAVFTGLLVGTGNISAVKSELTSVDSGLITVTPAAPNTPIAGVASDGYVNTEEVGDLDVAVGFGVSGAIVGNNLELLLGETTLATYELIQVDIDARIYTFDNVAGLEEDGEKGLTARVIFGSYDGVQSDPLTFMLDTEAPSEPTNTDITPNLNTTATINNVNNTTAIISGTVKNDLGGAEVNASVEIVVGGSGVTTVADASGVFAFTNANLVSAGLVNVNDYTDPKTVTLKITDQAGNSLTTLNSISYIKDTVAPDVTIATVSATPTNVSSIPVTVEFTENVTGFEVSDISVGNGTAGNFAGSGTTYTFDVTPTDQGLVTISIPTGGALDITGNVNNVSNEISVTYDNIAPTVTLTTTALEPTNTSPISVTATFSESVTGFDINDVVEGNGTAGNFAGSGTTYTFDITPVGEGAVTVDVVADVAQDGATNGNTIATQLSRVYDNVPPAVPADGVITPNLNTSVILNAATDTTATITGTVEEDATVEIVGAPNTVITTADGSGVFTFSNANLITAGIAGGTDYTVAKVVTLKITDAATNNITTTNGISYTRDTVTPMVTINALTTNDTTPELTGTVDDDSAAIQVTVNSVGYSATNNGTTWTLTDDTVAVLGEVTYDVVVTATDAAGNVGTDATADELIIDATQPTVALTYNPASPVGPGALTITATYNEPIVDVPTIDINQIGTTDIAGVEMTDSGNQTIWTYGYTVYSATEDGYEDGTATVSLSTVADAAGNDAVAPTDNTFDIDTGAPVLTIVAPIADSVTKTTNGTVALEITLDGYTGVTCEYKIDGGEYKTITDCADGNIVDEVFDDGRYILYIKATDSGGNSSEQSVSIVIDDDNALSVASAGADFDTIQGAVDKATAGDTINIAAETTYTEDLVISKQLELIGADKANTIIKGVANVHEDLWPLGDPNIEILADGVIIHGFTIQGPDYVADYYASGIILSGQDIEIYNNNFVTVQAENTDELGQAITTVSKAIDPAVNVSGLNIHNNTFTGSGTTGCEAIYINPHIGDGTITIDTNSFSGSIFVGVSVESENIDVTNNTIIDSSTGLYGIRFFDTSNVATYDTITVSGNTIQNFDKGIRVGNSGAGTSITASIISNTITGNDVGIWGRLGNNITATNNTISGNITAIQNDGATAINAEENWFGDIDPSDDVAGTGTIDYSPWLGNSPITGTAPNITTASHPWTWYTNDSIQDAIDAASAGDTVNVLAGTYTQDLVISKQVELISTEGAIIKGVDNVAMGDWPLADPNIDILADGVIIHGFTIESPDYAAGYYSSGIVIGATSIEIYNNAFKIAAGANTDEISQAIQAYHDNAIPGVDISGLNIHDNTFTHLTTGAGGYEGIYINYSAGVGAATIQDNQFSGDLIRAITSERSNNIITDNSIITDLAPGLPGGYEGISIRDAGAGGPHTQDSISITGNTVKGSGVGKGFIQGIRIGITSQTLTNISITGNTVGGDNTTGILMKDTTSTTATISNNILTDNTTSTTDNSSNSTWSNNTWSDFSSNDNYPISYLVAGTATSVDSTPVGRIDATLSTVAVDMASQTAGSDITVTLTAMDASSNLLSGIAKEKIIIEMTEVATENTITQPASDTVSGVTTGAVSTTLADIEKTVSVKVGNKTIDWVIITDTEAVTFTPAVIATLTVTTAPDNNPITTTETSGIIITGKDAYGNVVTNDSSTIIELSLPVGSGYVQSLSPTSGTFTSDTGLFNSTLTPVSELPSASVTVSVKAETTNLDSNISGVLSGGLVIDDGTAPQVTVSPTVGDINVLRTVQPVLTFNETMSLATLIAGNIQLRKDSDENNSIGADVEIISDTQVRLKPVADLDYNTPYFYYISGATDTNGVGFVVWDVDNKSSHTFTTENHELEAPYITNWSPTDGSNDLDVDTAITLNFNEKLSLTGNASDIFRLRKYGVDGDTSTYVSVSSVYNGDKQVTITPSSSLDYGQQYFIHIVDSDTNNATDLVGNRFGTSWQLANKAEHEFITIQGMTVQVYAEKTDATANDTYVSGWRYRYEITLNTDETRMQVQFPTGWTSSATSSPGSISTAGNMRMLINESTGGQITGLWSEGLITGGQGSVVSYELDTTYAGQNPLTAAIVALDSNDTLVGRQLVFYVFTKIPAGTEGGIYTADYGIYTSTP